VGFGDDDMRDRALTERSLNVIRVDMPLRDTSCLSNLDQVFRDRTCKLFEDFSFDHIFLSIP
jgi:hypothetical protein